MAQQALLAAQAYEKERVVAVDIGTACFGLAYGSLEGTSSAEIINIDGHLTPPSVVLLWCHPGGDDFQDLADRGEEIREHHIDFSRTIVGCQARDKYNNLDEQEEAQATYFERFKSYLTNIEHPDPVCSDFSGARRISAELLYTAVFRRLQDIAVEYWVTNLNADQRMTAREREHFAQFVRESSHERQRRHIKPALYDAAADGGADHTLVATATQRAKFVVTSPAMWHERAQQILRAAAIRAGLASPRDDDLEISIEPEAASFAVRYNDCGEDAFPTLDAGEAYMVCDCGGGTIDFTCHVQTEHALHVREALANDAGKYGSMRLDVALLDFVVEMLTPPEEDITDPETREEMHAFVKGRDRAAFLKLLDNIESAKLEASKGKGRHVNLEIPMVIVSNLEAAGFWRPNCPESEATQIAWKKCIKRKDSPVSTASHDAVVLDVETEPGIAMLRIDRSVYETLICMPTHTKIVQMVKDLMKNAYMKDHARYLFVVGGFSKSRILRAAFEELRAAKFPHLQIRYPPNPETAVVAGAVYFGRDPQYIKSRIMKYTFGVEVKKGFREGIDDDLYRKAEEDGGGAYFRKFMPLVERGKEILFNHKMEHTFHAPTGRDSVQINLFRTCYKTPSEYLDAPEQYTPHGSVDISLAPLHLGNSRRITLQFRFHVTEFRVVAINTDRPANQTSAKIAFGLESVEHLVREARATTP